MESEPLTPTSASAITFDIFMFYFRFNKLKASFDDHALGHNTPAKTCSSTLSYLSILPTLCWPAYIQTNPFLTCNLRVCVSKNLNFISYERQCLPLKLAYPPPLRVLLGSRYPSNISNSFSDILNSFSNIAN